jgi:thioredoxin-related protein
MSMAGTALHPDVRKAHTKRQETSMHRLIVSIAKVGFTMASVVALAAAPALAQAESKPARRPADAVKTADAAKRAPIYDKQADVKIQIDKAITYAKKDNKRILLMFGGDWCGWCHKLHELFASNQKIAKILYNEYRTVMVELESPGATELLEKCKGALSSDELSKGVGYPFLAVLDTDGKVVTAQRTNSLEEGDHHDPARVEEFLSRWKVPPKDAKAALADALLRASSDDKRVFLTFGAPWCGWCHRLDDWMAQPEVSAILERDFIVTKIDIERMIAGDEIMKQYRADSSAGIPWYAILDPAGKKLATADQPGSNIGYPYSPEEIDSFLTLLKGQARRIDAGGFEKIRKSLNENAEKSKNAHR